MKEKTTVNVEYKGAGKKVVPFEIFNDTCISFDDGTVMFDLAKHQQDFPVQRRVEVEAGCFFSRHKSSSFKNAGFP